MKIIHFNLNKQSICNYFHTCFTCKRTVCLTWHNDTIFWLGTYLEISQAIYNPCINRAIVRTNCYAVVFFICKIWRWEPFMFQILVTLKHLKKSVIILFQTIHSIKPIWYSFCYPILDELFSVPKFGLTLDASLNKLFIIYYSLFIIQGVP